MAQLRGLAIVHSAIEGKTTQPTLADLHKTPVGRRAQRISPAQIDLPPAAKLVEVTVG
jgi:hypothetical protein